MAVPDQVPFNQYSASGATNTFPYTFKILGTDQIVVKLDGVTQVSGFTVSGVGADAGGNVVFSVNPAASTLVELIRTTPASRSTDYAPNGDLREEVLDADFDRAYMALQEMKEQFGRAMKLPQGSTDSAELGELQADAYLRVNSAGTALEQVNLSLENATVAALRSDLANTSDPAKGSALVGFLQSGSGAVGRTARSKMRDRLCIFDFMTPAQITDVQSGAAALDHTAAMDAALNEAVARKGILYLPAGTYRHNGRWFHNTASYLTIEGDGESTVILNTDRTTNNVFSIYLGGDYITIRNLRHNGEKASLSAPVTERYGIWLNGSYNMADRVTVHDTINNALVLQGDRSITARNCIVRDIGYDNAHLNTGGICFSSAVQVFAIGNTVYNCGRSGIFSINCQYITYSGNTVDSCENGLRIDKTDFAIPQYATITGNVATNGYGDGIRASGKYVTVSGNTCHANGGSGISTAGGSYQTFSGNTLTGNVDGIRLGYEWLDTDKVTISGNTICDNSGSGVHLVPQSKSMTNVSVTGNNLLNNTGGAIRVENCTGAAASLFAQDNHHASGTIAIAGTGTGWSFGSPDGYRETLVPIAGAIVVKGSGVYGVSGTDNITSINACNPGTLITLYFAGTASGTGLTDTATIRLAGSANFVYTPDDTITLVCNTAGNWLEVCRSVN